MKTAQQQVDDWNRASQTGVCVDVRRDNGAIFRTVTRSSAQVSDGIAVIWVKKLGGDLECCPLDRVARVPMVSDEDFDHRRASGACICEICGNEYRHRTHPDDLDHPSYDGLPCLVKLCDGRLVKL